MGVASSISEMPAKMVEAQRESQAVMQERMRRTMLSQQVAMSRERTWWFVGAASAALCVGIITKNHAALIPVAPLSLIGAYTADMGYGTKVNRIADMHRDVLNDPRYFFHGTFSPEDIDKLTKHK